MVKNPKFKQYMRKCCCGTIFKTKAINGTVCQKCKTYNQLLKNIRAIRLTPKALNSSCI